MIQSPVRVAQQSTAILTKIIAVGPAMALTAAINAHHLLHHHLLVLDTCHTANLIISSHTIKRRPAWPRKSSVYTWKISQKHRKFVAYI